MVMMVSSGLAASCAVTCLLGGLGGGAVQAAQPTRVDSVRAAAMAGCGMAGMQRTEHMPSPASGNGACPTHRVLTQQAALPAVTYAVALAPVMLVADALDAVLRGATAPAGTATAHMPLLLVQTEPPAVQMPIRV